MKTLEAASYMAGVLSLALIAVQLISDASDRKIAKSLDMAKQFGEEPLNKYKVILLRPWIQRGDLVSTINRNGGLDKANTEALVRLVLTGYKGRPDEEAPTLAIHEIADYYNQVAGCVSAKICDAATISNHLSVYATQFRCLYGGIIDQQQIDFGNPDLGRGLRIISGGKSC